MALCESRCADKGDAPVFEGNRRQFLSATAGAALLAASTNLVSAAPQRGRRIAIEEHIVIPEVLDAYSKLAATSTSPAVKYLQMFYANPLYAQKLTNLDIRLAEMDRAGLEMQLLQHQSVQDFDAEQGTALAALANDRVAAIVNAHPDRFAALATIAPQDPQKAAAEIERAMTQLGFHGISIYSHTQGEFLDAPKFAPILEAAVKHRAPIYLHPGFPPDSMIEPFAKYQMVAALWGFQAETGLHAMRMILGGVFDRFPDLQIVLGHMGEALPYWLYRTDDIFALLIGNEFAPAARRARPGGAAPGMVQLQKRPSEYFRANFHVTTSGMFWNPTLEFCVKVLGPERVLFAVDYPFEDTEIGVKFIERAPLSARDRGLIQRGNAERLFRIKAATVSG